MLSLIVTIFLVNTVFMISPGPDFLYVSRTAMSSSRRAAIATALGVTTSMVIWAGLSCVGLGWLFERYAWLQQTIAFLGGLYILWMGLRLLWGASRGPRTLTANAPVNPHPFLFGLFTNLSNPKVLVFYTSFFSAFITPEMDSFMRWIVFAVIVGENLLWWLLVACVLGQPLPKRFYQKCARVIDAVAGVIFCAFGLRLLWVSRPWNAV